MKSYFKVFGVAVVLFSAALVVNAQEEVKAPILTEEQKELAVANKEESKANREAFKATLSDEQLAILENKEMTKHEKMKDFAESLSEEQQTMRLANKESMEANRDALRATLTDEQKEAIKAHKQEERKEFKESLSEEQKELIASSKADKDANHEAFKATLSDEQLAIMKDEELGRKEKQAALRATLTEEQQELRKANAQSMKENRQMVKETLTEEQKEAVKKQAKERARKKGDRKNG